MSTPLFDTIKDEPISRSIEEPIREGLTWDERWKGPDNGLINCWEVGRQRAEQEPEFAEKAKRGELPVLGWKGGVEKKLKKKEKYGTLSYLAEWQGLRGEDLSIVPSDEVELVCSTTGMKVIYTPDDEKYAERLIMSDKSYFVAATVHLNLGDGIDGKDREAVNSWLKGKFYHHDLDFTTEDDHVTARVMDGVNIDLSESQGDNLLDQLEWLRRTAKESFAKSLDIASDKVWQFDVLI